MFQKTTHLCEKKEGTKYRQVNVCFGADIFYDYWCLFTVDQKLHSTSWGRMGELYVCGKQIMVAVFSEWIQNKTQQPKQLKSIRTSSDTGIKRKTYF
jgi:hypothetical protein